MARSIPPQVVHRRDVPLRIRIVVAADVRLIREWLTNEVCAAPDFEVVGTAAGRAEAVSITRRLTPDVLLFDRRMPDGLVAVREILAEHPRVRVLAFGVQETEAEVAVCSDAGVHGFVARDATRADLVENVRLTMRGEFVGSTAVSSLLLRYFARRTAPLAGAALTAREVEIVRLIELGRSNKEIAAAVGIEVATVKNHVHRLLRKLQARRRSEAAAKWRRAGPSGGSGWVARRAG
jgi:DNA-binding NarL/FixJ family response regulator